MKTLSQINTQIDDLTKEKFDLEKKHSGLCQIDMLSGEGSDLRKRINILSGKIESLQCAVK